MVPLYLCPLALLSQLWGAVSWKAMELSYWLAKYQLTMAVVHQMLYLVIALGMVVPLHITPWILFISGISILTLSTYNEDVAKKLLEYTYDQKYPGEVVPILLNPELKEEEVEFIVYRQSLHVNQCTL
ncbi:hypothetical protein FOCC_FOCC004517 [Frankliniella occidentalis]|nr:hypothetical protein FOCC_FOCC004517 [Frankliniella occidentalis]